MVAEQDGLDIWREAQWWQSKRARLGNLFGILWISAITLILDLLDSGIFFGKLFF
jgi:hypothetical protein